MEKLRKETIKEILAFHRTLLQVFFMAFVLGTYAFYQTTDKGIRVFLGILGFIFGVAMLIIVWNHNRYIKQLNQR